MKSQSYALNIAEQQCFCPRLALVKTFLLLIKTKIFSRLPQYGSAQFSAKTTQFSSGHGCMKGLFMDIEM